jgi:hypothetical protein
VVAADFDSDGHPDLAVSVFGEGLGSRDAAGMVNVMYGSGSGVSTRDQTWSQASPGISGSAEADDAFGFAIDSG